MITIMCAFVSLRVCSYMYVRLCLCVNICMGNEHVCESVCGCIHNDTECITVCFRNVC